MHVQVSVWESKNLTSCYGVLHPAGLDRISRGVADEVQPKSIWEFSKVGYFETPEIPSPAAVRVNPNSRTICEEGIFPFPTQHDRPFPLSPLTKPRLPS